MFCLLFAVVVKSIASVAGNENLLTQFKIKFPGISGKCQAMQEINITDIEYHKKSLTKCRLINCNFVASNAKILSHKCERGTAKYSQRKIRIIPNY